jgi:hypothetical protein
LAHVSHKLSTPIHGALAGSGDPASSPLSVYGPFLRLSFRFEAFCPDYLSVTLGVYARGMIGAEA